TYSIDGSTYSTSGTFSDLSPGEYNVTVKSSNGECISTATTITINEQPAPVGQVSITNPPITERCQGTGTTTFTAFADNASGYNWRIEPTTAVTSITNGVINWAAGFSGEAVIYVAATGC